MTANKEFLLCILLFVGLGIFAVTISVVYIRSGRQKVNKTSRYANRAKVKKGDKEFDEWIAKFDPLTKLGLELTETTNKSFSKFGGLPVVPATFNWPYYDNRPIPFLLQVDFAEINADNQLAEFPSHGLMYVFVDSDGVNFAHVSTDGDYFYKEGKTFKILYFNDAYGLKAAEKPPLLETVYNEFYVFAETVKTYPDPDDCEEAFAIYCDRPEGGMDDAYNMLQWRSTGHYMIGGWGSYVQSGGFQGLKEYETDAWTLLMQIGSADNDEKFMWGDCGVLYFYIREKDLKERNFSNVKMDMQCT